MNAIISVQQQAACDGNAAVDFLLRWTANWSPDWFVNVCAIPAMPADVSRRLSGRSYTVRSLATNRASLVEFIERRNAERDGIYFSPNPLRRGVNSKASKADLAAIFAMPVDLDPLDGPEPHEVRQAHLLLHVENLIQQASPPVAVATFSGNGAGIFYLLPEPLALEHTAAVEEVCEALHARSTPYAKVDGTHNIDRVMRLPNTLNWPNASKLKRGYPSKPSLAEHLVSPMQSVTKAEWNILVQQTAEAARAPRLSNANRPTAQAPVAAETTDVCAAWGTISSAQYLTDLPDMTQRKFAVALREHSNLRRRWNGDTSDLNDTSRSGITMSLVAGLRRAGMSAIEAASIAYVHTHGDLNDAAKFPTARFAVRAFTRAWDKAGGEDQQELGAASAVVQSTAQAPLPVPSWSFTPVRGDILVAPPPPRQWVYGTFLMRGHTTILGSPGGVGKTSLLITMAMSMTTGRPLLAREDGHQNGRSHRPHRRFKVAIVNLEDPIEELDRRVAATARHYEIAPNEFAGRLFLDSGRVNSLVVVCRAVTKQATGSSALC